MDQSCIAFIVKLLLFTCIMIVVMSLALKNVG